jgi:hypothetical protein
MKGGFIYRYRASACQLLRDILRIVRSSYDCFIALVPGRYCTLVRRRRCWGTDLGAIDRIASCCGRYVDVGLNPMAFSCLASPALRCGWHYAIPSEAAVHARERPCLSEGGTEERVMVANQTKAARVAAERQRTA